MTRTLVTGAAGLIGYEIARACLERGDEVVAVDHFRKGGREDLRALSARGRLRVVEADLTVPGSLAAVEGRFDSVFHLAAVVGVARVTARPYETLRVNLQGTLHALDFAVERGCRVFHFASSSENYAGLVEAGHVPLPTPEDVMLGVADVSAPRWSYAASKIAGESMVFASAAEHGLAPVVLRFHNVYGPRMPPTHVIPELAERIRARVDPFPVYGMDQTRSFLHSRDAARATLLVDRAAHAGRTGVYNVGSDVEVSIADLARQMFDLAGWHPVVEPRPAPRGSVPRRVPDVAKLNRLGFRPGVPLAEGLREVLDGLRPGAKP